MACVIGLWKWIGVLDDLMVLIGWVECDGWFWNKVGVDLRLNRLGSYFRLMRPMSVIVIIGEV